jgi:Co/Zn/Cd efflux system component
LTAWLIHEAVNKIIRNKKDMDETVMLITAGVGLICNLVMCKILHSGVNKLK